jgi:hypothetical protein
MISSGSAEYASAAPIAPTVAVPTTSHTESGSVAKPALPATRRADPHHDRRPRAAHPGDARRHR